MEKDPYLQRMKRIATGLLAAAAVVYVAAKILEPRYPWLFYVAATSEAAMIGAIADWFAVVALFHHPLNLRFLPHTAIVPRNKGRIAAGLSQFIQENFLTAQAVMARIAGLEPARTLAGWLLRPQNAETVAGYAARACAFALTALDDERARRFLHQQAVGLLGRADIAGAAAEVLDVLTHNGRHHALLDEALAGLDEVLAREETRRVIAEEVARSSPPYLKSINEWLNLKLDERAALKIVEVALRKISEVRQDRDHELRRRFDRFVLDFIARLKADESLRRKVHSLRDEALASPALAAAIAGLWQDLRAWLAADLARRPSATHQRLAGFARGLGDRLAQDAEIRGWIDEQILAALPPLVEEHRARIGRFVEDQINAWHEERLVAELERHIGPDLQYIRINGTLVGGAAGLAIAAATRLAH